MSAYARPELVRQVFLDDEGEAIPYGRRWDLEEGPPEQAYSVVTHPARFTPLTAVAKALISHLIAGFDVALIEEGDAAEVFRRAHVVRTLRLEPASANAAPLTFGFTEFPGVHLAAGVLNQSVWPTCGCDACDDDLDWLVDDLENTVFAVVEGRFQEAVRGTVRHRATSRLWGAWGERTAEGIPGADLSREEMRAAKERLDALTDGTWRAWPERRPA